MWRDPALFEGGGGEKSPSAAVVQDFAEAMAARLGVGPECVIPAYEDAAHFVMQESGCRSTSIRPIRKSTIPRNGRA